MTAFSNAGADVVMCDRAGAALVALPAAARHHFDLTDQADILAACGDILAGGVPDVLVNNAGWTVQDRIGDVDAEGIAREIDLNLTGTLVLTHALLPAMRARGSGAVVFVASVNAVQHYGNPAYAAAKAGLVAAARAIAVECGRDGIRANAVLPGSVRTPAWDARIARDPSVTARLAAHYPLGRIVTPAEVAQAVLFLASDAASGITGVALPVDAGLTAGNLAFVRDIIGG